MADNRDFPFTPPLGVMGTVAMPPAVIPNLKVGLEFLGQLSPAPQLVSQQINQLLDNLLHAPPPPDDFFRLLEQLGAPLYFAGEGQARRYTNKALPLNDEEEGIFSSVTGLWRKMLKAYNRCSQLSNNDTASPQQATRLATILHRCLHYTGQLILEHYRARREQPEGLWIELHGYFDTAQEWGVSLLPVEDIGGSLHDKTNGVAAYCTHLLLEIANPYGRSVRDLKLISQWASQWGMLVQVRKLRAKENLPSMVIDLMQDRPMHPPAPDNALLHSLRLLDTNLLIQQVHLLIAQLDQKQLPADLGLGDDSPAHIRELLRQIAIPWSLQTTPRRFPRFACNGKSYLALGFEAMHYFITGKEFEPLALLSAATYSGVDPNARNTLHLEQLRPAIPQQRPNLQHNATSYDSMPWEVLDQSATGFRLRAAHPHQNVRHGQLMAILPHDGKLFLLCQAIWLMQENSGALLIGGVTLLPGLPSGVAVRSTNLGSMAGRNFIRAFFLPEQQGTRGSLVLPLGHFRPNDTLEVLGTHDDKARRWKVLMKSVLRRGTDFEHVLVDTLPN